MMTILSIWLPSDWGSVFIPDTPILEIVVRGTVIYLTLFFFLRFVLQREAAGISMADVLVVVLVADAVQNGMAGDYTTVTDGLILGGTIIGWAWGLSYLAYRFPWFRRIARPRPILLIHHGRLNRKAAERELLTEEEIMASLRQQGVERIEDVERAYMEGNGVISVIPRSSRSSTGSTRAQGQGARS